MSADPAIGSRWRSTDHRDLRAQHLTVLRIEADVIVCARYRDPERTVPAGTVWVQRPAFATFTEDAPDAR
jgi:hypothetical protein